MNNKFLIFILMSILNFTSYAADGFAVGGYVHNVIISKNSLYVAGNNYYGELTQPNSTKEYRNYIKLVDKVDKVSANYNRTAFITQNNKLYYFGWRTSTTDTVTPTYISNNVSDVTLTNNTIYYISNKKIYEFSPKFNITKELVLKEEPVKIVSGTSHIIVLTKNGNIYSYGNNGSGQLCTNNFVNKTELTNINNNCNTISCGRMYKSIAASGNNSYFVTKSGELKACGDNSYGQFGIGKTSPASINNLTLVPNATTIEKVVATNYGVYILKTDGLIDLIGWHNYISPSYNPYNRSLSIYTMTVLNSIKDIGTGLDNVYVKDNYGEIYAWGGNGSGKLGDGTIIERHYPVVIHLPEDSKAKHCTMDLPCNNDPNYK